MPDPLTIGALVSAGSNVAGNALNSLGQIYQNRRSEKFSREMFAQQDAINLRNWNMQNEYNSPQSQMKRYQEAGLNPHLIYGQGNSGNAGAVPTPDVQPLQYRSPDWGNALKLDGLGYVNAIYDLDIKQAQIDNMKAQNTVILQDALLKAAQTRQVTTGEERSRFDLDFESELRSTSADARREALRQMKVNTDYTISKDGREAASNASTIQEAFERMIDLRERRRIYPLQRQNTIADTRRKYAEIANMRKDGTLKQLDIDLRKDGINPNDPTWMRIVGRILTDYFENDGESKTSKSLWERLFGN